VEKDRDRYLQAQKLIQDRVPLSKLVEEVKKALRWHGIDPSSESST
jgi:hypothetical protein